jgi:phage terminase large subunit GpA-like protein
MKYNSLAEIVIQQSEAVRPPERLLVSEAAEKYRYLNNPGAYVGPWRNDNVPMMVEPMDCMVSRDYTGVIFVGPAQSSKTELFLNLCTYRVACDPMDMILYQTAQHTARDFSIRRLDRLIQQTEIVQQRLLPGSSSDNVFDKKFLGMLLTLSWPSINELSGRPIGCCFLTDYDRMPQNVDGEGNPFDLARKRTTTFGRNGMTVAESSPGYTISDPKWLRQTPNEAPPCEGILALYNRGDRRRLHWKCPHCRAWFEPEFKLLIYPDSRDLVEAAEMAKMSCPHCTTKTGALITPDMKYELNLKSRWVKDGQRLTDGDKLIGTPYRSDIASFWMKGPAAAFQSWKTLVLNYLNAEAEFRRTGSQEALKTTVNTDQGEAYATRGLERERTADELKERAEILPEKAVPEGVRALIATIDVQKNRFVAQVFGVSPSKEHYNLTVIDRIDIIKSKRLDSDGERLWVKPATFVEDWQLIIEEVMDKQYPLADGSGYMSVHLTSCDSGGKAGVTSKAYEFYKWLKQKGAGRHKRFLLSKGDGSPHAPRARVSYPDSQRKDRTAGARGEVPVLMLNTDTLKDKLNGMLDGTSADGGTVILPDWLSDEVFTEYTVEVKDEKGKWQNPRKARNEAWDLTTYAIGQCIYLGIEKMDWEKPPRWLATWDRNTGVTLVTKEEPAPVARRFAEKPKPAYDKLSKLAEILA